MARRKSTFRKFKKAVKRSARRARKSAAKFTTKAAKRASKLYAKKSKQLSKWQARRQGKAQKRVLQAARKVARTKLRVIRKEIRKEQRAAAKHAANVKGAENSFAAAIINSYRIRAGMKPVFGEKMLDLARKLVAQKVKSVGFLRSGWIEATRAIASRVGTRGASLGGTINAGPRGYAIPAKFTLNGVVYGEIGNTVPGYKRKAGPNFPNPPSRAWTAPHDNPMPYLVRGLQAAVNDVTASMAAKLTERLQRDWRSVIR